jgi:hypothetical protein
VAEPAAEDERGPAVGGGVAMVAEVAWYQPVALSAWASRTWSWSWRARRRVWVADRSARWWSRYSAQVHPSAWCVSAWLVRSPAASAEALRGEQAGVFGVAPGQRRGLVRGRLRLAAGRGRAEFDRLALRLRQQVVPIIQGASSLLSLAEAVITLTTAVVSRRSGRTGPASGRRRSPYHGPTAIGVPVGCSLRPLHPREEHRRVVGSGWLCEAEVVFTVAGPGA